MNTFVREEVENTISVFQRFLVSTEAVMATEIVGNECGKALIAGQKIMLAGNGGSAADAQHIAAEFISRLQRNRQPLASIALTTDTSVLTAIANDYGYDKVFQRQVDAFGNRGDVFIAISTSGNSPSILEALRAARNKGIYCAGFTGENGGLMAPMCDAVVRVPSNRTQNIQEVHIMVGHTVCAIAELIYLSQLEQHSELRASIAAASSS